MLLRLSAWFVYLFSNYSKSFVVESSTNLARNKAASQSSHWVRNHYPNNEASKAIDGCASTLFDSHCCTHTDNDYEPWWQLDLGQTRAIFRIVITRRWESKLALFSKLAKLEIKGSFYNILKHMYLNNTLQVRIKDAMVSTFELKTGVRQGDNISPNLINIFINDLPNMFDEVDD